MELNSKKAKFIMRTAGELCIALLPLDWYEIQEPIVEALIAAYQQGIRVVE